MKTISSLFLLLVVAFVGSAAPLVPPLLKENAEEMLSFYRDAAAHGSPKAMLTLASYNENGIGMPVNRDEAVKWYRKVCSVLGQNQDGIQDEAVKGLERLGGIDFPFDPQTADGNTIIDFISAQTNRTDSILACRLLRQKTLGRTLTFTNMVSFYVQRVNNGDINLTLEPIVPSPAAARRKGYVPPVHNSCSSLRVLFKGEAAKDIRYLDREDVVARLEGLVVTNCPWYWGFVLEGVSLTPQDPSIGQPLPPFDAAKISGDELVDYLHEQRRPVRKWQYIDMQSRLAGRRLTFHKLRLFGARGVLQHDGDAFWISAVPRWETVGEGDQPGQAEFRLSFKNADTREFAAHLVSQLSFAFLDEVTGTFTKNVDLDDGWAFQLEDVSLLPSGMVKGLDDLGEGTISGDELIRKVGSNFTPMEQLSIAFLLKGREMSFTSGVVESCRPCWTNDTLSLTCRLTPNVRDNGRSNPFRVTFEVPSEKAQSLRRTPIPGDLVVHLKGRLATLGKADTSRQHYSEHPVLALDHPDFDITWQSDIAKTTGLDSRPGERILRRLALCWREVRADQFIRLTRQINGQKVEFPNGKVLQSTRLRNGSQFVKVMLVDPLYGDCVELPLLVTDAHLAKKTEGLKYGTTLRHISGSLTAESAANSDWDPVTYGVRLKNATFEIIAPPPRP